MNFGRSHFLISCVLLVLALSSCGAPDDPQAMEICKRAGVTDSDDLKRCRWDIVWAKVSARSVIEKRVWDWRKIQQFAGASGETIFVGNTADDVFRKIAAQPLYQFAFKDPDIQESLIAEKRYYLGGRTVKAFFRRKAHVSPYYLVEAYASDLEPSQADAKIAEAVRAAGADR